MKPLTILAFMIIGSLTLAAYRLYDWWVCTRIDRKNRREKRR